MSLVYSTTTSNEGAGPSITLAVVVPASAVYCVLVWTMNANNGVVSPTPTFNGSSTGVTSRGSSFGSAWGCCGIYTLSSPPTGTYNISSNALGSLHAYSLHAFFFDTFTALGTFASANGTNASTNTFVDQQGTVVGSSGDVIISAHSDDTGSGGGSFSSRSGTANGEYGLGSGDGFGGAQSEIASGTNTTARISILDTFGSGDWAWCGIAVTSPAGSSFVPRLSLMGMG